MLHAKNDVIFVGDLLDDCILTPTNIQGFVSNDGDYVQKHTCTCGFIVEFIKIIIICH